MTHSKSYLRNLDLPNNYKWFGFIDGYHYFKRKVGDGWHQIRCRPKDIEDNNINDMTKLEVTL